ncbi:MAG: helix-turn-helix domain-containing protein [Propionibacteriaceae bacterium]|jgi:excisionase family DNA binding protein|nr:helix-turn-helix domain-containing protein [Propionibacteriaceae bacterium]
MQTLEKADQVVIPPSSVALNPSLDSDWATALLGFVERMSQQGKTVVVQAVERMFSPQEAARIADVSRATILRRIEDGTIKATKRGSHWRISESELVRYQRAMLMETAAVLANDW